MARNSAVNAYPNCLLCGVEIYSKVYSQIANPPRSATCLRGAQCKATPAHVVVPSKEVEDAEPPEFPKMWSCMCRAIIKAHNSEFVLSGIIAIETDHTRPYIVPKCPGMNRRQIAYA
ncbi:hypothetical protein N7463_008684 [Penicillium fimorum]|uniref:Uncharacterized protein n=1 Tax=Penicillium fimorum TaxID=1882269 RepID=A0A9W9XPC7_9EURO|nr:hypothetical protein N7463_008684 [Penicillium fimorum]